MPIHDKLQELDVSALGARSRKLSNVGLSSDGWLKMDYLELLRAPEGAIGRWSWLHLQSLAPTNPYWARVVGYGPFSLCLNHKEGLCFSSGDINRLMMINWLNCLLIRCFILKLIVIMYSLNKRPRDDGFHEFINLTILRANPGHFRFHIKLYKIKSDKKQGYLFFI
jgi:hypothetical protein